MRKIIANKKLLLALLVLVSVGILAQVPLYKNKSVFDYIVNTDSGTDDPELTSEAGTGNPITEEIWKEIDKLAEYNGSDSITMSGKISLYDNLDKQGIREEQRFSFQQAGNNQWLSMETLEKIHLGHTVILIDHQEKEIILQDGTYCDSLVASIQMLSGKELRKLLAKDGTTAEMASEGSCKKLSILPGAMDAVNRYELVYDPANNLLRKLRLFYTSFPYQDYLDNNSNQVQAIDKKDQVKVTSPSEPGKKDEPEETEIDLNITEYVLEFAFDKVEKKTGFDFTDNELFKIHLGNIRYARKLADYTIINN